MGRIDQALERAARRKEPLALLLIDLDNFEKVYDSLDYHAGDELLRTVGLRLRNTVGAGYTVAPRRRRIPGGY